MCLWHLEDFDLNIGIVVDYMHGILLGVTKTMMELWFLAKNSCIICYRCSQLFCHPTMKIL